jgi:hypothetical protein
MVPNCEDDGTFKLYVSDVGLLTALYGFEAKRAVVLGTMAGMAKGAVYENLVAGMLARNGHALRYWRDRREPLEVEFLLEKDGAVVPVEVKASNAATASLDRMLRRADIPVGYKLTAGNVGVVGKKVTLPHYMGMFL